MSPYRKNERCDEQPARRGWDVFDTSTAIVATFSCACWVLAWYQHPVFAVVALAYAHAAAGAQWMRP